MFIFVLSAVLALSASAVGVMAVNRTDVQSEPTDLSAERAKEIDAAIREKRAPILVYSDAEKEEMANERKQERANNALAKKEGWTFEEQLIQEGRLEELAEYRKFLAETSGTQTDEDKKFAEEQRELAEYHRQEAERILDAAIKLAEDAGYYPEGVDKYKYEADEDYSLDVVCNVCRAYSERKNEMSAGERSTIVKFLNDNYNGITSWYPQTDKTMDTYELIEKTIDVEFYNTQVERR